MTCPESCFELMENKGNRLFIKKQRLELLLFYHF